ncbi:hypothetical protein GCM10022225_75080 [Plantactinospora mayteni]|uniref:Uncharacterized protein n=1 Tax=Plantactinospora mayteni TaxID=566021 RepID=A0ABQ4EKU6_9ACTN|nr:hypothetical protein Pma05_19560 [Plantactinospora mayteni]
MSAAKPDSTIDLTSIPRAVLSVAVGMVQSVERVMIGDARMRTARGNAWEAICADRDRALRRDEIRALVAALAAVPPAEPATIANPARLPAGQLTATATATGTGTGTGTATAPGSTITRTATGTTAAPGSTATRTATAATTAPGSTVGRAAARRGSPAARQRVS